MNCLESIRKIEALSAFVIHDDKGIFCAPNLDNLLPFAVKTFGLKFGNGINGNIDAADINAIAYLLETDAECIAKWSEAFLNYQIQQLLSNEILLNFMLDEIAQTYSEQRHTILPGPIITTRRLE